MPRAALIGALLTVAILCVFGATVHGQSSITSTFDHFTTGFRLDGAHQLVSCEACHSDGMFSGTPTQCEDCHTQASRIRASFQPARHILSSQRCEACHRTTSFAPVARVDHFEVFGQCFSCHNGNIARGKPADHIPATNMCESCHNVRLFSRVARVDHLEVVGVCSGCHNGVVARGQHPQHIPTTAECDSCHNTQAWR